MLFTWKDVENLLFSQEAREKWNTAWKKIRVYPDEIVIYKEDLKEDFRDDDCLCNIFERHYSSVEKYIGLDVFDTKLSVTYEGMDEWEEAEGREAPLFKDMFLRGAAGEKNMPELSGSKVVAFHSYKGGVGRTLSLIALLKEVSNLYGNKKKILVIDSDLEAPGLTWILEQDAQFSMSYIDLLSIWSAYGDTQEIIEKIADVMQGDSIYVNADRERVQHYFLPAYLRKEQMVTMMPRIDSLVNASDDPYFIADAVSRLGKALGADLVLVDLRAGVSNISAPFLFDPRVQKFFVSSTSLQSIMGTQFIEEQVYQKSALSIADTKIFMTMVPPEMDRETRQRIMDQLTRIPETFNDGIDETYMREEYAYAVDFETRLLGLGDFAQICEALQGTGLSQIMNSVAAGLLGDYEDEMSGSMSKETIRKGLKRLHEYVNITAESSDNMELLITDSIHKMIVRHRAELPNLVVLGAKGSGKTYLYRQFVLRQNWNRFAEEHCGLKAVFADNAAFIPVLATAYDRKISPVVSTCIEETDRYLGESLLDHNAFETLREKLRERLRANEESGWVSFWESSILGQFAHRFSDLQELNTYLGQTRKNIIFLFDGLDDIFNVTEKTTVIRTAVQTLCYDLVRRISGLKDRHIGAVIFVRRDIAEEAIPYNYQQFRDQYKDFELNWSQTEALRLALWAAGKALPEFMPKEEIRTLVREDIEERLERLWGKRLGSDRSREANSARWILAALSDLKGQLQARDIVRFLFYATDNSENVSPTLFDRYIMPQAVRAAIEPCAKDKLTEIKTEMKGIYHIFEKFTKLNPNDRKLPLQLEQITLSVDELTRLEEQGYIKVEDKQYYLPEIIRQALGYQYRSGARPKVLSLLVK